MSITLVGANGRMGQAIQQAAARVACVSIKSDMGRDAESAQKTDVVIDFSSDTGARRAVELAVRCNCALLVGTTGLSESTVMAIQDASREISTMKMSNSSLGIAILTRLASIAATLLGTSAHIAIHESHHIHKKDSPSGTAITLAEAIRAAGGAVSSGDIHSHREGEVVGDHRVTFEMEHETLSLEHKAINRDLFALGALRMADWLRHQPAGMHFPQEWLSDLLLKSNQT